MGNNNTIIIIYYLGGDGMDVFQVFTTIYTVINIVIAIDILLDNRDPSSTVAWIMVSSNIKI